MDRLSGLTNQPSPLFLNALIVPDYDSDRFEILDALLVAKANNPKSTPTLTLGSPHEVGHVEETLSIEPAPPRSEDANKYAYRLDRLSSDSATGQPFAIPSTTRTLTRLLTTKT